VQDAMPNAMAMLGALAAVIVRPPFESVSLAPRLWLTRRLLSGADAESLRKDVEASVHYPCPRQERLWPLKRCAKLPVSASLHARLREAWPALHLGAMTTIAASIDVAGGSADRTWRHHAHADVFPEREMGARGPDMTAVVYLSEAPAGHPADLAAPTVFPRLGVAVSPEAGSMLSWANVHDDGTADPDAQHGVGPYAVVRGTLPPRVALHIPISLNAAANATAIPEHVGCSGPPRYLVLRWERLWRWRVLVKALRRHMSVVLVRKLRAAGLLTARLLALQARAAERVFAPGGMGFACAAAEFAALAGQLEEQVAPPACVVAAGAEPLRADTPRSPSEAGAEAHTADGRPPLDALPSERSGMLGAIAAAATLVATAVAAKASSTSPRNSPREHPNASSDASSEASTAQVNERRRRKAAMAAEIVRLEEEARAAESERYNTHWRYGDRANMEDLRRRRQLEATCAAEPGWTAPECLEQFESRMMRIRLSRARWERDDSPFRS